MQMKTRILFVCLGNICRSPAAEASFLKLIAEKGLIDRFDIDSAGTGSWHVGHLADERMRKAAEKRGIMINSVARQIQKNDFQSFDYILTMDLDNLREVNALSKQSENNPNLVIKTILSFSGDGSVVEVPDPYYGGEQGFDLVLDLLEDACQGLFEAVSGSM